MLDQGLDPDTVRLPGQRRVADATTERFDGAVEPPVRASRRHRREQPFRPADPDYGPGRWVRVAAGIREDVLDWVPEERPRYSGIGTIILNTGILAGLSMSVALGKVITVPWLVLLPVCAFWTFIVITIDRWLIASTHGGSGRPRFWMFLPRLLLSAILGFVIAEPLLLWVFQPAIHKEVLDQWDREIGAYSSQWTRCNRTSDAPPAPDCRDFQLSIPNSPSALEAQLRDATSHRVTLKAQVDGINAQLTQMDDLARAECNGRSGQGLSGQTGEGPNCRRDRQEADQFRADSKFDQRQADLNKLDNDIIVLTGNLQSARTNYAATVATAIDAKVAERRRNQGQIGLLDEDSALGRLESHSFFVRCGAWLLRLLLVALDCLPVLTKVLSGSTRYDLRVSEQAEYGSRAHDRELAFKERSDHQARRVRVAEFDDADRVARSKKEADRRNEIDALAARLFAAGQAGAKVPNGRAGVDHGAGG